MDSLALLTIGLIVVCCVAVALGVIVPELYTVAIGVCFRAGVCFFAAGLLTLLLAPMRVIRKEDSLVLEFPFHRHTVPLCEVLEVAALSYCWEFFELLKRWNCLPCGSNARFFCGLPSWSRVCCAVVTGRCFWSFIFCVEDPIEFLLDCQRPLDLNSRFVTVQKVLVRKGESLDSPKVNTFPRGSGLHVLQQRGRRIRVKFECGAGEGWMSYINVAGRFLIVRRASSTAPSPGLIGASTISGSYGTAIELPAVTEPDGGE